MTTASVIIPLETFPCYPTEAGQLAGVSVDDVHLYDGNLFVFDGSGCPDFDLVHYQDHKHSVPYTFSDLYVKGPPSKIFGGYRYLKPDNIIMCVSILENLWMQEETLVRVIRTQNLPSIDDVRTISCSCVIRKISP